MGPHNLIKPTHLPHPTSSKTDRQNSSEKPTFAIIFWLEDDEGTIRQALIQSFLVSLLPLQGIHLTLFDESIIPWVHWARCATVQYVHVRSTPMDNGRRRRFRQVNKTLFLFHNVPQLTKRPFLFISPVSTVYRVCTGLISRSKKLIVFATKCAGFCGCVFRQLP